MRFQQGIDRTTGSESAITFVGGGDDDCGPRADGAMRRSRLVLSDESPICLSVASSVPLGLMLRADPGSSTGRAGKSSDGAAPFAVQALVTGDHVMPFTGAPVPRKPAAGCDDLLAARLIDAISSAKEHARNDGPALPDEKAVASLVWVRLVVSKDQVISYERSGARTYGEGLRG